METECGGGGCPTPGLAEHMERLRKEQARDPYLEERVARERFHLVKKDETLYRYKDSATESTR